LAYYTRTTLLCQPNAEGLFLALLHKRKGGSWNKPPWCRRQKRRVWKTNHLTEKSRFFMNFAKKTAAFYEKRGQFRGENTIL